MQRAGRKVLKRPTSGVSSGDGERGASHAWRAQGAAQSPRQRECNGKPPCIEALTTDVSRDTPCQCRENAQHKVPDRGERGVDEDRWQAALSVLTNVGLAGSVTWLSRNGPVSACAGTTRVVVLATKHMIARQQLESFSASTLSSFVIV